MLIDELVNEFRLFFRKNLIFQLNQWKIKNFIN